MNNNLSNAEKVLIMRQRLAKLNQVIDRLDDDAGPVTGPGGKHHHRGGYPDIWQTVMEFAEALSIVTGVQAKVKVEVKEETK